MADIMHQVGMLLSTFSSYQFLQAGFLNSGFNIKTTDSDDCIIFADRCLHNNIIAATLYDTMRTNITQHLNRYHNLLPTENEKNLVHGDFDPANNFTEKMR